MRGETACCRARNQFAGVLDVPKKKPGLVWEPAELLALCGRWRGCFRRNRADVANDGPAKLFQKGTRRSEPGVMIRTMDRCNNCRQALIEIDNRGRRLIGCLTCNQWSASGVKGWIRLDEEDVQALHYLRRNTRKPRNRGRGHKSR
jgi:hypothetical protein